MASSVKRIPRPELGTGGESRAAGLSAVCCRCVLYARSLHGPDTEGVQGGPNHGSPTQPRMEVIQYVCWIFNPSFGVSHFASRRLLCRQGRRSASAAHVFNRRRLSRRHWVRRRRLPGPGSVGSLTQETAGIWNRRGRVSTTHATIIGVDITFWPTYYFRMFAKSLVETNLVGFLVVCFLELKNDPSPRTLGPS